MPVDKDIALTMRLFADERFVEPKPVPPSGEGVFQGCFFLSPTCSENDSHPSLPRLIALFPSPWRCIGFSEGRPRSRCEYTMTHQVLFTRKKKIIYKVPLVQKVFCRVRMRVRSE